MNKLKFQHLSFDKPISQDLLNISNKTRSNFFPWRGQFSPQFIESILLAYCSPNSKVLDPFLGSGTVLFESGRLNLEARGVEINPSAAIFSKFYQLINLNYDERFQFFQKLQKTIFETIPQEEILSISTSITPNSKIKEALDKIKNSNLSQYERIIFEALIVLLDFFKNDLSASKIFKSFSNLKKISQLLPFSESPICAEIGDARRMPFDSNYFDFVLTSPPYINVFNYHQQFRESVEFLGWDLLNVSCSEVGSNRKFRQNRFLTVIQYCLDISQTLNEIARVCKKDAKVIFIVGRESNVRKTRFFNGQIVSLLAEKGNFFKIKNIQERVFINKFGQNIYEDIIQMVYPCFFKDINLKFARDIATEVLKNSFSYAPDESKEDLHLAIEFVEKVNPSSFFDIIHKEINSKDFTKKEISTVFHLLAPKKLI